MVDIVVVSYNMQPQFARCLQSIRRWTEMPYRLVVVDNGSSDGSPAWAESYGGLVLIRNQENRGYAAACNQGIQAGGHPLVVIMNCDTEVTRGWLAPLVRTMMSGERVAAVGPKLVNRQGLIVGAGTDFNWQMRGWMVPDGPGIFDQPCDCLNVCGACYMLRRDLLSELGLFDEQYFFYFEELDYSFNALYHGYRVVYCPDSTVIHDFPRSDSNNQSASEPGGKEAYFRTSEEKFNDKWVYRNGKVFRKGEA